ncbi:MAG: hypothetical protein AAFY26_02115 [Cyanobacteria bacterium J06638_22]
MDEATFRQHLIIAAVQGFSSNPFLAEQLAVRDATAIVSALAILVADKVIQQTSKEDL